MPVEIAFSFPLAGGLHARPASRLQEEVVRFRADGDLPEPRERRLGERAERPRARGDEDGARRAVRPPRPGRGRGRGGGRAPACS